MNLIPKGVTHYMLIDGEVRFFNEPGYVRPLIKRKITSADFNFPALYSSCGGDWTYMVVYDDGSFRVADDIHDEFSRKYQVHQLLVRPTPPNYSGIKEIDNDWIVSASNKVFKHTGKCQIEYFCKFGELMNVMAVTSKG